ncbi:MAG TPA: peptidoglycan-binding protein, partial [Candidatus Pacebacteria bacterium]|nr:peptidoglycan-binding protein [Candidatus Paceibacterota bacterium]
GKVDGIIGPNTKGAILRLQKFLGTKQDGYVGPKTRGLLNESCGKTNLLQENLNKEKIGKNTLKTNSINSIMSRGLTDKITNGDVTRLQKILKNNGYKITVDGIFG